MTPFSRRRFLEACIVSGVAGVAAANVETLQLNQSVEDPSTSARTVDFRYAPRLSQATICFPDDPKNSLVGQLGDLRYDFAKGQIVGGEDFGTVCTFSLAGTQNVSSFPQHPRDPYSANWLFGIQQEVAPKTVITINYTGNEDHHMQAGVDFAALNLNPANFLTQSGRPFSGFANESFDADALNSSYPALQAQVRHNSGRLNLEANYTWSHEIDNMVNVFGGFSDPTNPNFDRGPGDWDIRHNFTASAVYDLPDLKGSNALVHGILGGWQTSNIIQTRTGGPVNPQLISGFFGLAVRPDLTGQPIKLSNASWPVSSYNVNAFAVDPNFNGDPGVGLGDAGRNSLRAPGFFQWDFSLMKNFPIREKLTVQFRADIFNIFNHPNFGNPDVGICTAVATPVTKAAPGCAPSATGPSGQALNPNFGRVGQTIASANSSLVGTGTARQEQFSLKLIF